VEPFSALPESHVILRNPGWKTLVKACVFVISHNSCHLSEGTSKDTGLTRNDNIKMILLEGGCVGLDRIHVDCGDERSQ
jgi:hypothetical protein